MPLADQKMPACMMGSPCSLKCVVRPRTRVGVNMFPLRSLVRVSGTCDVVSLPPGVPLVSLRVGLSAFVSLCIWGAVACADPRPSHRRSRKTVGRLNRGVWL